MGEERELFEGFNGVFDFLRIEGFGEEGFGPGIVGLVDGVEGIEVAHGHEEDLLEIRLAVLPTKKFEAIRAREAEVEENDAREGKALAIGEMAAALEVLEGFSAGAHHVNWVAHAGGGKGAKQEEDVSLGVVCDEDEVAVGENTAAFEPRSVSLLEERLFPFGDGSHNRGYFRTARRIDNPE